jgi:predicted Zn-dependent protease
MKKIKNSELDKLIKEHQYFCLPHLLKLSQVKDEKYHEKLNSLSLRNPKREFLEDFIKNHNINLDRILDEFIENNPKISKANKKLSSNNLANERIKENNFATENLAEIYIKQNKISEAIKIYKKLLSNNSKKKSYFAKKIEKLKS